MPLLSGLLPGTPPINGFRGGDDRHPVAPPDNSEASGYARGPVQLGDGMAGTP